LQNPHSRYQPRFDHPFFQQAFKELVGLLAAEFDGNPLIEFIDTFMYGFWGEGHTWPFGNNPFPDYQTAERTWTNMLEVQLEHFKKTPLLTNTQPDYSRVGNSELVDRTVRSNNWIRSDTIFIENEQIEALSNRPPWTAALLEQGLPGKPPDPRAADEGITPAENMIAHVIDVGANYWSLWNFHQISARNLMGYYEAYPAAFDQINRRIGYWVRPSFISCSPTRRRWNVQWTTSVRRTLGTSPRCEPCSGRSRYITATTSDRSPCCGDRWTSGLLDEAGSPGEPQLRLQSPPH
jgi:hypothetical protein